MANVDLSERAYKSAPTQLRHGDKYWIYREGYVKGATEERERCISIVEQFLCTRCVVTNKAVCRICESKTLIRKAMEGENNG